MKNGILVSFLALGLAACGGESGSDSENPNIKADFAADIKGLETQPAITNAVISEGDTATLNTNYTGSILDGSSVRFSFTLVEDKQVALILSSSAQDLDLSIYGNSTFLNSALGDSNEVIVLDALAGETYSVKVESWEGSGEFQLKLVEANRSSVGLSADEYLVRMELNNTINCTVNGEPRQERSATETLDLIINWSAGYIENSAGAERESFSSVSGNSYTVNSSYTDTGAGWSESGQGSITVSTEFTTGAVTGSADSSYTYTEGDYSESCTIATTANGQVLL